MKSFNPSKVQGFLCVCFIIHQVKAFSHFSNYLDKLLKRHYWTPIWKTEAVENEDYELINCYILVQKWTQNWSWMCNLHIFRNGYNLNRVLKNILEARILKFCINKTESHYMHLFF